MTEPSAQPPLLASYSLPVGIDTLHVPENLTVAVGLHNGDIYLFPPNNFSTPLRLQGHHIPGAEYCLVWALASSGNYLFSGGQDAKIIVWDLRDGKELQRLEGHTGTINALQPLNAEPSQKLISASADKTIGVWDLTNGQCEAVLSEHEETVRRLDMDNGVLISGSSDATARLWEVDSWKPLHVLRGHNKTVWAVKIAKGRCFTAGFDSDARVWDVESGACLAVLHSSGGAVTRLLLHDDVLVTANLDAHLKKWSLDTYQLLATNKEHEGEGNCTSGLDSYQDWTVTAYIHGQLSLWHLLSGTCHQLRSVSRGGNLIWRTVAKDGKAFVAALKDGVPSLEVWSLPSSGRSILKDGKR